MRLRWILVELLLLALVILNSSCTAYNNFERTLANSAYEAQGRPDLKKGK